MNQKQLANVLVKILGLAICADSVVRIAAEMLNLFTTHVPTSAIHSILWNDLFSGVVLAVIGVTFIKLSRPIVDLLFQGE
jgi:hypothetical protein